MIYTIVCYNYLWFLLNRRIFPEVTPG